MSSSPRRNSISPSDLIIDIPPTYLQNGKSLLIEEYFELFVDGYHLSKPSHFISHIHQLCLIDTQQQDLRSLNSTHELQSDHHENQLVQLIIEFPSESLNVGKSVQVKEIPSNNQLKLSGNIDDLYNLTTKNKEIVIEIPEECLQRGKTIFIQKGNIEILNQIDYQKQQIHHLNNQFAKRDYLQSKNSMEMSIELPPEFFHRGQTITFRKEDPILVEENFPYRRQSKGDIQLLNQNK